MIRRNPLADPSQRYSASRICLMAGEVAILFIKGKAVAHVIPSCCLVIFSFKLQALNV